jgi:hypothetical protein
MWSRALFTAAWVLAPGAALADEVKEAPPLPPVDSRGVSTLLSLSEWTPSVELRGRFEFGDQDGRKHGTSLTLRGRLGLATPTIAGFRTYAEIEHTSVEDRDSYQAASVHGLGRNRTIIADPESTELNQIWLGYGTERFEARIGRQLMTLDDSRFVGDVGWRNNDQTYDAATVRVQPLDNVNLFYAYVTNVERIFGSEDPQAPAQDDFDSRSHFVTASFGVAPWAKARGYAYFMDLSNKAGDVASNDTFGAAVAGAVPVSDAWKASYELQAATQRDAASSPVSYRAQYLHGMASLSHKDAVIDTIGVGYELLAGDNGVGFQTPLATLHKFNGFADVFLDTPGSGLIDRYAWIKLRAPFGISAEVIYHDFAQEDSRGDFGREYDIVLARALPFLKSRALLKYAVFTSETPMVADIRRFTFQIEYTFGARPPGGSAVTRP